MTDGQTYYQILGISPDAEDIVIRAAYRVLAQKYHPDKWRGDPLEANHRMRQLNEAYETLSDAAKRSVYDSGLEAHRSSGAEDRTRASDAESERYMRPDVEQATAPKNITEGRVRSLLVVLVLGLSSFLITLAIVRTILE
jgi:DnaJ-class molecular chaperone